MEPRPLIMGVLNVTPDSFSDGGKYLDPDSALTQALRLVAEGADIIDVGGESTRPGAAAVSAGEEIDRVIPVIDRIRGESDVAISIDTGKLEVARLALAAGATIVNDVTGGADPGLAALAAREGATVVLMHMRGNPRTMQDRPEYPRGVACEVRDFLRDRVRAFEEAGVSRECLWVDPGIGFGKTFEHNLLLLRCLGEFRGIGGRLVVGTSRKSFLARVAGDPQLPCGEREPGTLASGLWALSQGAGVLRVHDVLAMRRAVATWEAIRDAR